MPTNFPSAVPSVVDSWDYLLTQTAYAIKDKFEDNVFKKLPLLNYLQGDAETEDGGFTIVRPLMSLKAFTADVATYEMYDTIAPTEDTQGFTAVEYRWRQLAASIAFAGIEEARNNGARQIINLVKSKFKQLEMTVADKFNTMFYADPGGGSKDFNGLAAIVGTGNPTRANLGGIDASTNAFWRSQVDTNTEPLSLSRMSNIFNACSQQNESPDQLFTTQALWEKYESLLQPQLRYSDAKTADAGFQNLIFKSVPVVWDPACTSGVVYFLNRNHIKLVKHSSKWMSPTPFVLRYDKDARYSKLLCYGEVLCDNRSKLGKLTNKS